MNRKLNKPLAGFHLLNLIAHADGKFVKEEGDVIVKYLSEFFPFQVSLDDEIECLSTLPRDQYMEHFRKVKDDFYEDTNQKERNHFLDFAVKLAKADNEIPEEENIYLKELFNFWAPEFEEEA